MLSVIYVIFVYIVENWMSIVCRLYMEEKTEDIEKAIKKSLCAMGTYMGADRVLFSRFEQESTAIIRHNWCATGFDLALELDRDTGCNEEQFKLPFMPWIEQKVRSGEIANIRYISELPEQASLESCFCNDIGIASFLIIPVCGNDGFLFFSSSEQTREWTSQMIAVIRNSVEVFEHMLILKKI